MPILLTAASLYPDWDDLPDKVGCLNNLFLREGYRHLVLASKLFGMAMNGWRAFTDVEVIFIYVSNGNEAALDFYLSRGFAFSHDVFGGFIKGDVQAPARGIVRYSDTEEGLNHDQTERARRGLGPVPQLGAAP